MYCTWKNKKCKKSKTIISKLKNRLIEGLYKWVNSAPIFFATNYFQLLTGLKSFQKKLNISMQKLIFISDYMIESPFLEKCCHFEVKGGPPLKTSVQPVLTVFFVLSLGFTVFVLCLDTWHFWSLSALKKKAVKICASQKDCLTQPCMDVKRYLKLLLSR